MVNTELGHLRTGNHVGRTIYRQDPNDPRGVLVGVMDTPEYAAALVSAHNARLEPSPFEEDLRKAFDESERRRRIALLVLSHHQEHLAFIGREVLDGFDAVRAVLNGKTDPKSLGIEGNPVIVDQVRVILASQDGDRDV